MSPQRTDVFFDKNNQPVENSIAEIRSVTPSGVEQRILIRGESIDNPTLLRLHGGPEQAVLRSSRNTI